MSKNLTIFLDEARIASRVKELGAQIRKDYGDDTPIHLVAVLKGAFIFLADLVRAIPGEVSLDLRTSEPRLSLPAGMFVLGCRAVVLRVTTQVDVAGLRWSCESPPGVAGSPCSGEGLDAQEWEAGNRLVVVGTEDEDALASRLGLPLREPYRGWVRYSPSKLEVRLPRVPASGAFGLHFIVAENTSPEPVESSAWFAVDIPHEQLAATDSA